MRFWGERRRVASGHQGPLWVRGKAGVAQVEGCGAGGCRPAHCTGQAQPNSSDRPASRRSSRAGLRRRRADFTPLCQGATPLPFEEPLLPQAPEPASAGREGVTDPARPAAAGWIAPLYSPRFTGAHGQGAEHARRGLATGA